MTLSFTHRFAQSFALAFALSASSIASTAVALTYSSIITDTPVSSVGIKVEDIANDSSTDLQRIRLRITGAAELTSGKKVAIEIKEDRVAISIPEIPGALSLTSLYRDGDVVIARERLKDGELFAIGRIGDNQELELNPDYHIEVEYRQYRFDVLPGVNAWQLYISCIRSLYQS